MSIRSNSLIAIITLSVSACGSDPSISDATQRIDRNDAYQPVRDAESNPGQQNENTGSDTTDPNSADPNQGTGEQPDGNSYDNAIPVQPGDVINDGIDPAGEEDWYRFVAEEAPNYEIFTNGSLDTRCYLYDDRNQQLAEDDDAGEGLNCKIVQTLSAGRTYYVMVRAYADTVTGEYTLSIAPGSEAVIDPQIQVDPPNGVAGTTFNITGSGFTADSAVTLDFRGEDPLDPVELTADGNGEVSYRWQSSRGLRAGNYHLRLTDEDSGVSSRWTGVSLEAAEADDHGDRREDATDAGSGGRFEGQSGAQDDDWFRFRATVAGEWTITTESEMDTVCTLFDLQGEQIARNDDDGEEQNCLIVQALEAGTTYYVLVEPFGERSGDYTLVITGPEGGVGILPGNDDPGEADPNADDHGDNERRATLLPPLMPTSGSFDKNNDEDWFAFVTPASGVWTFMTLGFSDPVCTLFGGEGEELDSNDNGGVLFNCMMTRQLEVGEIVFIRITRGRGPGMDDYAISAAPPGEEPAVDAGDDHGDSTEAATQIQDDANIQGNIEDGGDNDYMQFIAGRDGAYRIATSGGLDTVCRLLDSDGTEIAQNDDGGEGLNCQIDAELTQGRRYFLHIRAWGAEATGDYGVALSNP
ncbi:MAG: hypothetical protein VX405_02315 [Myxococcota bacterium]|nr:hypothetical protein [Myxococcota bacterium]